MSGPVSQDAQSTVMIRYFTDCQHHILSGYLPFGALVNVLWLANKGRVDLVELRGEILVYVNVSVGIPSRMCWKSVEQKKMLLEIRKYLHT